MTAPIVNPLPYKPTPDSILEYARFLKGKTFWEVLEKDPNLKPEQKEEIRIAYNRKKNKARYGDFIQENFFYVDRNSDSNADLTDAGVELKVSPYIKGTKGKLKAKERMVLTKINYMKDYGVSFEDSHLLKKCGLMLLVYYFYDENKADEDYLINYVDLFQLENIKEDYEIIKRDYYKIIHKIKEGKAHELSEGDTMYLGACTKAADSSVRTPQPFSDIPAKPRAFSLKNTYMTMILNEYLAKDIHTYHSPDGTKKELEDLKADITYGKAIKDIEVLKDISIEDYIISKMEPYYNRNTNDLLKEFGIESEAKSVYYMLAKKMLGVSEDRIEEFEKANIKIKTIRLKCNGEPKEAMSFPAFKYMEIINQDYYDSDLYNLFYESKFLFMVFQYTDKENTNLIFKKAMFWNVPGSDLEGKIKLARNETKRRIVGGEYNKLVNKDDDMIIHVRPHGRDSSDTFPTPDGGTATKKCFWFNKKYLQELIEKEGN